MEAAAEVLGCGMAGAGRASAFGMVATPLLVCLFV